MRQPTIASLCWSLLFALAVGVPSALEAASYYWGRQPNHERLVFQFTTNLPPLDVARTADTEITVRLPGDIWDKEARPAPFDLTPSRLVAAVRVEDAALVIVLRRPDVDHLAFTVARDKKIVVDLTRRPKAPETNATNATAAGNASVPAPSGAPANATAPAADNASARQDAAPAANATALPYLEPQPPAVPDAPVAGPRLRAALNASAAPAAPAEPQPFRVRSQVVAAATPEQPAEVVAAPAAPAGASGGALEPAANGTALPSPPDGGVAPGLPAAGPPAGAEPPAPPGAAPANASMAAAETAPSPAPPPLAAVPSPEAPAGNASAAPAEVNASAQAHEAELENLFQTVQDTLARGDLKGALDGLEGLRRHPGLPDRLREEVLYTLAELRMKQAKDDIAGHYLQVREAFLEALHFNPASARAPQALINLGYLNLSVGNEPEAQAYFDLLRRKHPQDFNVPLIDYYWGEYYARRGQWSRAADHFQAVIQQYPDSQPVLPSAVGLVRALAELGFWAKAWEIVDFVEKRWPRYYIDDPEFLSLAGQVALNNDHLDAARERLWLYYNLLGAKGPSADMALARIGDIYLRQGKPQAAKTAYEKAAAEFPEREGGLIAMMRLAEEGIVDEPTLEGMAAVFDRPFTLRPERIYTDIVTRFPDSPLAPVARLKLAMWYLWTGRFDDALAQGRRFLADYPGHALVPRAEETVFTALTRWMARDAEEENFRGLVTRFEANPDMAERLLASDRLRLALALAYLKLGQPERTLELARPFFFGAIPRGEFSLPALDLALAVLVDLGRYADVVELAGRVKDWDLGEERQRQLDYALALAFENLGRQQDALGLWTRLAMDVELPPTQRGHAVYFLARAAYAEGEWERAYLAAQEAVSLLLHKNSDPGKIGDALAMLVDITEHTGRLEEALGWAAEYERRLPPGSPQWPGWIYRTAQLQRRLAREAEWRASLQAIIDTAPDSLYARMAKSELAGAAISERLERLR